MTNDQWAELWGNREIKKYLNRNYKIFESENYESVKIALRNTVKHRGILDSNIKKWILDSASHPGTSATTDKALQKLLNDFSDLYPSNQVLAEIGTYLQGKTLNVLKK